MPKYMLLLYTSEATPQELQERDAALPLMLEFADSLRDAGILLGADRLHPVELATTVRVRNEETEIIDGPYATTKEFLAGYFLLECEDLDEALRHAARMPLARFGTVEVRPVMDIHSQRTASEDASAAP